MKRLIPRIGLPFLALTLLLAPTAARAQESNRNEVRANLEKDGWRVIWGKNFTEADWVQGAAAIAESVAAENPGPFLQWFNGTLQENFALIQRNLRNVTTADLKNWILQSLKEKKIITYRGLKIEAGFATYNRWKRIVVDVPDGVEWEGIHSKIKMNRVEKRIPLPNWNQFYIRYKLVPNQEAENPKAQETTYQVTVANDTGEHLTVYVYYLDLGQHWETAVFSFPPGERANLNLRTRNRYIGFRAESPSGRVWEGARGGKTVTVNYRGRRLKFEVVDMGSRVKHWTHTFR